MVGICGIFYDSRSTGGAILTQAMFKDHLKWLKVGLLFFAAIPRSDFMGKTRRINVRKKKQR
jgi:hypothetical protein